MYEDEPALHDRLNRKTCKMDFHNFEKIGEDGTCLCEQCSVCGKKVFFTKWGGRVDNFLWRRAHRVDLIQPIGRDEKHFYRLYSSLTS